MKKYLLTIVKFALAALIIGWLLWSIDAEQYAQLRDQPKNWPLLSGALVLSFLAVCVSFVRWWLLVRSLDLQFRLRDSFRLGFLSYLLNFVSVGSVGGDVFKAIFIAREQPGRKTEAVATVIIDRVMGLYGLLVVTSGALLLGAFPTESATVQAICTSTLVVTLVGGVGIAAMLMPGVTSEPSIRFVERQPLVGRTFARVMSAIRVYRGRPLILLISALLSLTVHMLLAVGIFLAASGIFDSPPTLSEHFVIVPLANVAGALPFTPAGLGTFEVAMEKLYQVAAENEAGDGVIVALVFRLITIVIAAIGGLVYVSSRREMRSVMDDAKRQSHAGQPCRSSA